MTIVSRMADVTTPFPNLLFIFFVSCHVVCGSREHRIDLSRSSTSISREDVQLPLRHRRHQPQERHESSSIPTLLRPHLYPIFIDEPSSLVVGDGQSVSLNCSHVSPSSVDVVWWFNDSILDSNRLDRLGIKLTRYGVSGEDNYGYGDDGDDVGVGDDDDGGGGDDDGMGDDGVVGKSGKIMDVRRLGYYSNYASHNTNDSHEETYQDDDDDDDDVVDVDGDDDHKERYGDVEEGVVDVTNFRPMDFPRQRIRHNHHKQINKRHNPDEADIFSEGGMQRKRETGSDDVAAKLHQRPKSSIHKSLEILEISSFVPHHHEGVFQCMLVAPHLGSMLSGEARVEAATMTPFERIQTKIILLTAYLGGTVVIPCVPPYSRPEAVVEFKINGTKLNLTDRHLLLPSGNLQIWNLSLQDSSNYVCHAHNPVSNQTSQSSPVHTLHVIAPTTNQPTKYSRPHQEFLTAILGQNLTLECWAQGWPQPKIMWEKYGGHLPKDRSRTLMGNLLIERVENNDVGTYLCKAGNDVGIQPGDKVFSLEVLEPPTVFVYPQIIEVQRGRSVTINCKVEGAPRPTIQWWHNGQPMGKDLYQDSTLVLNIMKTNQAGTYQCFARNGLGVDHGFARVILLDGEDGELEETEAENPKEVGKDGEKIDQEIPAPSKPEVIKTNSSSVKVKWSYRYHPDIPMVLPDGATPPPSSTYPLSFRIQYKDVSDEVARPWKTIPDEIDLVRRSYEVKKLRIGGTYRFRVVVTYSNNDNIPGPTSAKVSITTKTHPPTPVIVDLRPINNSQMIIVWQIQSDSWLPDGFVISYARNDLSFEGDAFEKTINNPEVREAVLNNLEPLTHYKVRVHSYSFTGGKSSPSNTVAIKTPAIETPPRPNTKSNFTPPSRFNGDVYDNDPYNGGSNPVYNDANTHRNYPKGDPRDGTRIGGGSDKINQPNLVYILLGSILCLIVTVVVAFLISCIIRRRRHEFGEKEKEKLKEKGIERLKQSSSMATTAPLLRSESSRPGYPTSKSQTTLASQSFPSQTGIFQQNYQIKPKPSGYTGSAMMGDNQGAQMDSPYLHGNPQLWNQSRQVPQQGQEVENDLFYFQRTQEFQADDQNHIYSTLEEPPLKQSPHSTCPSATHLRFYSSGDNQDVNRDYPSSDHQIYQADQNGHHNSIGHESYNHQKAQIGRPKNGAYQGASGQPTSNRANNWNPADNPSSLTKEQATNTINTYYDNDRTADNATVDWSENAYSSLEGFTSAINQEQRLRDFSADTGAISSADSSSTDSDFRVVGTGPITSSPYQDEIDVQYPQQKQHAFYKSDSSTTTSIVPQHHIRNGSNNVHANHPNNFGHTSAGDARQAGQVYHHYHHSDRAK